MNKKQHIIISFLLIGLSIGISQVLADNPNPGHPWEEIECDADNLCVNTSTNRVGIGTVSPHARLDVVGGVKVGNHNGCDNNTAGVIRYNSGYFEGCNGVEWVNISIHPVCAGTNIKYGSTGTISGDVVYCDNYGGLWTTTRTGEHTWDSAVNQCKNLSYAGYGAGNWVLPTWEQLRYFGCSNCGWGSCPGSVGTCVNPSYCTPLWDPSSKGSTYWSSSVVGDENAWYVFFSSGSVYNHYKATKCLVRCRLGQ